MDKTFQIGQFRFRLCAEDGMILPENFLLFEKGDIEPEYTYHLCVTEQFPAEAGKKKAARADIAVYDNDGTETRYIGVKGIEGWYGCYQECSGEAANIMLDPDRIKSLHIDPVFSSLFALERHLIKRDSLILHCAYIRNNGEAILFSAPSETGKSTQAGLWEKYVGAETINGDRALLVKKNGKWTACGWPVCGSSGICYNKETPIRAIVMLEQGKSNAVERLSPMGAFSLIYGQVTINRWNQEQNTHAMDLIEKLVTDIPVYHLSCTISEEAVRCLKKALYQEE